MRAEVGAKMRAELRTTVRVELVRAEAQRLRGRGEGMVEAASPPDADQHMERRL